MKLSWKEVYTRAKVNPSTSAFQRDKFIEFFPCIGEGRHRKYGEEAIEVLSMTSTMYAEGKAYEEIKDALEAKFGVPITNVLEVKPNSSTTQQDVIAAIKEAFREEVKALEDKIDLLAIDARERDTQSQSRDAMVMTNIRLLQEKRRLYTSPNLLS